MRGDREGMREEVRQNGVALKDASGNLRGDREDMPEAVRQNGVALEHASENLRGDSEGMREAVRQSGVALEGASGNLRGDPEDEDMLEAERRDGVAAPESLRGDATFEDLLEEAKTALETARNMEADNLNSFEVFVQTLEGNIREDRLGAVRQNGVALEYASKSLRGDRGGWLE